MDINSVIKTIKELCRGSGKSEELRKFCKLKIDQVLKYLPQHILNNDGAYLLDCLLNGYTENSSNCCSKIKIVDKVLQTMRKEATSYTHCGDVISRLCLELPRLPIDDLIRWCNDSVQSIIDDDDINMIWRDVIPECLNIISAEDVISHCGTEMSGAEYKVQCIHTLCQCRWDERHLVQLAAMFKDMQLSRNEHRQVVNKLCSYVIDVPPDTLPPLIHQLLKLCKSCDIEIVLSHVSHYFSLRLYSKLEPPQQDSESTTIDIDDIVQYSPAELSRSLSTCLYHMSHGADPELMRKHIKQWPKTQLLRSPMLLDLALAVSDKGFDFRSVCLDTIKSAIELREMDEIRSKESAWVRSLLPPDVDVANLLKVLTTESANHRQLTVVGLINLAFVLLGVSKSRATAAACWSHGKLILARLCRSQPETAPHILSQLGDRLAADAAQRQYSDCLYVLCKLTPVTVERCAQLSAILESCQPAADGGQARATYAAVRPLVAFSTRVRDTLVMVCRKGLYSRDSAHRQLALSGFLTVLKHVKLNRGMSTSQPTCSDGDQNSAYSYFTQVTVDLHASQNGAPVRSRVRNEIMCLEVVSILRRCLVQDAAVKHLLYSELYECTREKASLHESVLELLHEHLCRYLPESDLGPPLLFEKCVQLTATGAVLLEPLGRLLYVVAQFLQPVAEEESDDVFSSQADTGRAYLRTKLLDIMDQLCKRELLAPTDMTEMNLSDLTPESKAKALKLQEVLQCYEALIAHRLMQWTATNANANNMYKMFKDCNQLIENTKVSPKNSKKGKSVDDTRDTVKSQKSQKSQKEKGKAPMKFSTLTKDRAGPFKPLPCLWDLQLSLRFLQLLYSEEVAWSSLEQRNEIRVRSALHVWALHCVQTSVRSAPPSERERATHLLYIAELLYSRCLCRFSDLCDFDEQAALAALDLFKDCLDMLLSQTYTLKLEAIFTNITGLKEMPVSASVARLLAHVQAALERLRAEGGAEDADAAGRKFVATFVHIATALLNLPVMACSELNAVIVKFEDYLRTSKQECLPLIPALLNAAFREHREVQLLDELLAKLTSALGLIDEEETSAEEESGDFPTIDARTGHTVLGYVCAHVRTRARAVEHVLARSRDMFSAISSATHSQQQRIEKELKEAYEDVVVQLCQLSRCVHGVVRLRWGGASAAAAEGPTGACMRLYSLLAMLAKQLPPYMAQSLRLERLLKLCGKKLSSACDALITYAEASAGPRTTRLVPRLVLEAETFSKNIILLEKKAKLNYQQHLSLGTARDFRIRAPVLEEVLGALDQGAQPEDDEDQNITDAETTILSPAGSERDISGEEQEEEEIHPRSKKRKLD